jgi:hypothetical protein
MGLLINCNCNAIQFSSVDWRWLNKHTHLVVDNAAAAAANVYSVKRYGLVDDDRGIQVKRACTATRLASRNSDVNDFCSAHEMTFVDSLHARLDLIDRAEPQADSRGAVSPLAKIVMASSYCNGEFVTIHGDL